MLVGSFLFKQFVVLTHAAGYLGYWRLWLSDVISPFWLNEFFNINIFLMTTGAIWFFYQFLKEYQPNRWGMRLFAAAMLFLPLQLVLQAFGMAQMALQSVAWLALVMPMVAIYLSTTATVWQSSTATQSPVLSRNQLTFFFAILALVLWVYVLPVLGLIRVQPLTLYGILVYNLVTSLMMMAALKIRAQYRQKKQAQVQEQLLMAEREVQLERERTAEQQRFMDMLTHELKNPLSTIRLLTFSSEKKAQRVTSAIEDMQNIIDRCAQLGQIESDVVKPRLELVVFANVLNDCREDLNLDSSRLHTQGLQSLPELCTDRQLLHIILLNLLDNAQKYSPPYSDIFITTQIKPRSDRQGIECRVANAVGSAGPPDFNHVFDKYYRSPTAQRISGSGLGLTIARGLAELLGGSLHYEPPTDTKASEAVQFVLWLPIHRAIS